MKLYRFLIIMIFHPKHDYTFDEWTKSFHCTVPQPQRNIMALIALCWKIGEAILMQI